MMGAVNILGADRVNADTAGKTGTNPVNDVPVTPTFTEIWDDGGISHILSGGIHPESLPNAFLENKNLEKATDSVKGDLGGLRARVGSVVQPGPSGGTNTAKSLMQNMRERLGKVL